MFSVSPAELITIAIVALIVFGPQRLPEITRKIGRIGRELSKAAGDLRQGIEEELGDVSDFLDDARRKMGATPEAIENGSPGEAEE